MSLRSKVFVLPFRLADCDRRGGFRGQQAGVDLAVDRDDRVRERVIVDCAVRVEDGQHQCRRGFIAGIADVGADVDPRCADAVTRNALFLEDRFAAEEGIARQFEDRLIVGENLRPVGGGSLEMWSPAV